MFQIRGKGVSVEKTDQRLTFTGKQTWFTLDCIQIGGALCEVFLIDVNASATRQSVLAQENRTLILLFVDKFSF